MERAAEQQDDVTTDASCQHRQRPSSSGGAVYGLGLIGALVWFWRQGDTTEDHVIGVLKALVWPAYLVYGAFKRLGD